MTRLTVSIDKPCSEKWDSFEKRSNTGFCASCQKNVVDFTKSTDRELTEYLKSNKGKTCGRLRVDQMKEYAVEENRSAFNKIAAILTAGVLVLTQAPDAQAQNKEVHGRVLDGGTSLVPGVNILIKGTTQGTVSDSDGNFKMNYEGQGDEIVLVYSFIGLQTQERKVNLSEVSNVGDTILKYDGFVMGEVVCIRSKWYTPRGLVQRVGSIFRRW